MASMECSARKTTMRIAVGCPIRNRAWIFPQWAEHVRSAFGVVGLKPYWVFAIGVGPSGKDDGTQKMVTDLYKREPGMWCEISEPEIPSVRVNWTRERLAHMADYRNALLGVVRAAQPDFFLSVDSDILLHPCALKTLLDTIEKEHMIAGGLQKFDAVGGKTFLSEASRHLTSWANLNPQGGLARQDSNGVFRCEVLMALKLMTPAAYNIDYDFHQHGEDIGWSKNCAKAGLTLGWDGRITSKHCMYPEQLEKPDPRVGW